MRLFRDCRNPVLPPDLHIPDPEAHVMPDGRVYVYGSWDQDAKLFCGREYRVFSSDNLLDWVDHGVSFDAGRVPWVHDPDAPKFPGVDWSNPTPFLKRMMEQAAQDPNFEIPRFPKDFLFAPDAIHKDGKYYLYFCLPDGSEGVAVSGRPEGPFGEAVQLPCGGIDPAVFIDDDGQAYYYWGQFSANGVRLKENMTEFGEETRVPNLLTEEEHFFHEGSSVRRRGDTYYLVYSCVKRGKPTSLAYATGRSPLGPFEYRGIIIDNENCDPRSWNNHGSIEEVGGQWFVFYHRSSRNGQNYRRLCTEPITFDEDGGIPEVPMTSQGAGRPFGLGERIEAYRACEVHGGAYIAPSGGGGEVVTGFGEGAAAVYRYLELTSPATGMEVEATGSGELEIHLGGGTGVAGNVTITGGHVTAASFRGPVGRHEVRVVCRNAHALNLISLRFAP